MTKLRKALLISYVVIFFAICIIPVVLFFFTKNDEMIEKKELAAIPNIIKEGSINTDFSSDANSYISDHFPYRSELLFISNHVMSDLLKSPTANVITGKDGWLFYEETADDYVGANALSSSDIRSIAVTISLIEEAVENNGGHFVFSPIPNKNSVYSRYMPIEYVKSDQTNLIRLYNDLDALGVNYVNLENVFSNAISESETNGENVTYYHKKDSHWNYLGAQLGYNSIMNSIDATHTNVSYQYEPSYSWDGDLEKLLYPTGGKKDLQYNMQYSFAPYSFTTPSSSLSTDELLVELMSDKEEIDTNIVAKHADLDEKIKKNKNNEDENSNSDTDDNNSDDGSDNDYIIIKELYMVRDSFGRALLPYMINEYDIATFVRTNCPYIATLNEGCDVVYEIVERNLENVISTAPYMYAPKREKNTSPKLVSISDKNIALATDEGYAYRIYGTIDSSILGKDSRIYIELENDVASFTFEAFPIYEEDLLGPCPEGCYGFSIMLDTDKILTGDYKVNIITGNSIVNDITEVSIIGADEIMDDSTENGENETVEIINAKDMSELTGFDLILEKSAIVYRNTAIHLGDNINDLTETLGKMASPPVSIDSCITGTTAKEYYYPFMIIDTMEDGTIFSVEIKDNGLRGDVPATEIGITLGSKTTDLDELIGSDYLIINEDPVCYTYSDENKTVYYYFDNQGLTNISMTDTSYQVVDENAEGYTPLVNGKYVVENYTNNQRGWKVNNGAYEYYDLNSGERILNAVVNGITIAADGSISHDANTIARIDVLMKARWVVENNTLPTDTLEEKRLKVFNWILSFPYKQHRKLHAIYQTTDNLDILFANDIFVYGSGDCVSESAALSFLFRELGYTDVYFCHDTGHSWVILDGKIFDPLFAESRGFDKNYDATPSDYRKNPKYQIYIP